VLAFLSILGVLWFAVWEEETHLLWRENSGIFAGYRLVRGPLQLPPEAAQSSGLAYAVDRQAFYVVVNAPPELIELDSELRVLRTVRLEGFSDTEGVAYLGDGQFAVVDERRGILSRFRLEANQSVVQYADAEHLQVVAPQDMVKNRGLEGVAFMAEPGRFFVIEERRPRRIFDILWPDPGKGEPSVSQPWDVEFLPWWDPRNLSDAHYDQQSDLLLVLSRFSKVIVALTKRGTELGRLHLTAGSAGLDEPILGAEGLTMGPDGALYVCAERRGIYVFAAAPVGLSGHSASK